MRTKKTCCCCGDRPCEGGEYKYSSTKDTNCKICALGVTTTSISQYENFSPSEPLPNQGDEGWWPGMDGDGHPDNLYMGNICWHNGVEGWLHYPPECDWDECWNDYEIYGLSKPPKVSFYQFDSPFGLLPWSPNSFIDWRENWDGPLLPQGDCTMHCTQDNIGCHTLAFVGAIGKNYGATDEADGMPLCGSDIVTIPPPRSEWDWIREWVKSGGKLIIMGESSGSPLSSIPSCRTKMNFFNPDSSYYTNKCENAVNSFESMSGEEVALLLQEFAFYVAREDDQDEIERFFEFENEIVEQENFINNFEAYVDEDGDETAFIRSCCQRSKRPFVKRDDADDPMKSFSFSCSSSSGLLPKGKGKGLVGHCNGDGCTVVWKPNNLGAVVVVYDSDVWGASNSQIPLSWWEQEAQYPKHQEMGLDAIELKSRSCNNDFWNFMCVDFLSENGYTPSSCSDEVYWKHKDSDDYEFEENPCLKTAKCCLPNGSCIETNIWDCFGYTDANGRKLPGTWYGSSEIHPDGLGGVECQTCGSCSSLPTGICCSSDPGGADCGQDCCLELDNVGFEMYEYECNCLAGSEKYPWVNEVEWKQGETSCDVCFVEGACCTGFEFCVVMREWLCITLFGEESWMGDYSTCEPDNPCIIPKGACCVDINCISEVTEEFCTSGGGEYLGDDSICGNDECEGEPGACCLPNEGGCIVDTEHDCTTQGGVWMGKGSTCADNPCDTSQACCYGANPECQECTNVLPDICLQSFEGTPQGNGVMCSDGTCNMDGCSGLGACCNDECECSVTTAESCSCNPFWPDCFKPDQTCEETTCCGVCCDSSDGSCLSGAACVIPEWVCDVYDNNIFTPCKDCGCDISCPGYIDCAGMGVCCVGGECVDVNSANECGDMGGVYTPGQQCDMVSASFCNLGACCVDGNCIGILIESHCEVFDGSWVDGILDCDNVECGTSACCYYENPLNPYACENLTFGECDKLDGTFEIGQLCEDNDNLCLPTGACCVDGACIGILTEPDCDVYFGTWLIDVESCEADTCTDLGACCLPHPSGNDCSGKYYTVCADLNPIECENQNGLFSGGGTQCQQTGGTITCGGSCCGILETWLGTAYYCEEGINEHYCNEWTILECGHADSIKNLQWIDGGDCCEDCENPNGWYGPCCFSGICQDGYTRCTCEPAGGEWMDSIGTCDDYNGDAICDNIHACCDALQDYMVQCVMRTSEECEAIGGTVKWNKDCDVHQPCEVGCCMGGGVCDDLTLGECSSAGGYAVPNGIGYWPCWIPNPYGPDIVTGQCPAACCHNQIYCQDLSSYDCVSQTDWEIIAGALCVDDPCHGDLGACCDIDNCNCYIVDGEQNCINGDWYGVGSTCEDVGCEDIWACCFYDGTCQDLNYCECWWGDGDHIAGLNCNDSGACDYINVGACCFPYDGICYEGVLDSDCWSWGGDFWGDGSNCWDFTCGDPNPVSACCLFADGVGPYCEHHTEDDCVNFGGQPMGQDSCSFVNCNQGCCECCDVQWDCYGDYDYWWWYWNNQSWEDCDKNNCYWWMLWSCTYDTCDYCGWLGAGTDRNASPTETSSNNNKVNKVKGGKISEECSQKCKDAGCECHCLDTRNGIVCL
jgi:hypothetical protein